MSQSKQDFNLGSALFQNIFGIVRTGLFFLTLFYFASSFSAAFHQISPQDLATSLRASNPRLENWPDFLVTLIACLTNWYFLRYMIAPFTAMLTVLLAGALYVKDVYALPDFGKALNYVVASMFTIGYPELKIDKGVRQIPKGEANLLDAIGGPGSVLVEPGSAAIFRHLREPSGSTVSGTRILAPFETIAHTIDLAEQQGDKDEIACMTRDGIKLLLRDVHIRYRITSDGQSSGPSRPGAHNPSDAALSNMVYNLSVQADGLESWNTSVERTIVGFITDFIAEHTLDYLTAPCEGDHDPRRDLLDNLYRNSARALERQGAELIWADFGHMEILEESVDQQRASLWAADWMGDASVARAYGDAKRQAYQELGRAEAQAEMIISIAEALRAANLAGNNTPENLRKILLARTAQVLDSVGSSWKDAEGG